MNQILNEKIYQQIEEWRSGGEYQYICLVQYFLTDHLEKLCYPNGDDTIYFPKKQFSEKDIRYVLDSLEIKYSYSTTFGFHCINV